MVKKEEGVMMKKDGWEKKTIGADTWYHFKTGLGSDFSVGGNSKYGFGTYGVYTYLIPRDKRTKTLAEAKRIVEVYILGKIALMLERLGKKKE